MRTGHFCVGVPLSVTIVVAPVVQHRGIERLEFPDSGKQVIGADTGGWFLWDMLSQDDAGWVQGLHLCASCSSDPLEPLICAREVQMKIGQSRHTWGGGQRLASRSVRNPCVRRISHRLPYQRHNRCCSYISVNAIL